MIRVGLTEKVKFEQNSKRVSKLVKCSCEGESIPSSKNSWNKGPNHRETGVGKKK